MLLDEYFASICADPARGTRSKITLNHHLSAALGHLGQLSEAQIREWAMPIKRNPHNQRLVTAPAWQGDRVGVGWPETVVFDPQIIGTVHTHPFAKKLSPDAEVGFSIGDFAFYGQMQGGASVKVHLVVCCRTVFLAVYRAVTRTQLTDNGWRALEGDEDECKRLALAWLGGSTASANMRYDGMMLDALMADQQGDIDGSGAIERDFFRQIPGYVELRSKSNHRMIRRAANQLRVELYWGRLGGALSLQSNRVCYSRSIKGKLQQIFG